MNIRLGSFMLIIGLASALTGIAAARPPTAPQPTIEPASALGTAFTYQGQLQNTGSPVSGACDFLFSLFDIQSGGVALSTLDKPNITVTNGRFTVQLDFGASAFTGDARWLEVAVGCPSGSAKMILSPRQALTPAPYALSVKPGAQIIGAVDEGLHVETTNHDGRGIRGIANNGIGVDGSSTTGIGVAGSGPMGVYGASVSGHGVYGWSSSGNAVVGYNSGSGRAGYFMGKVLMGKNAGPDTAIGIGDHYRDNGIVAWGKILAGGAVQVIGPGVPAKFGVTSPVDHTAGSGIYTIHIDATAADAANLIPIAVAEVDSPPVSAAAARIVSVDQIDQKTFIVYINDGNFALVDNDFVFMVIAR